MLKLLILSLLSISPEVRAGGAFNPEAPWIFRFGISESCANCLCHLLLAKDAADDGREAILSKIRTFRTRALNMPLVPPRLLRNRRLDETVSGRRRKALAAHLRGIEVWTESQFQERAGEAKVAAYIYGGSDAIERYYQSLDRNNDFLRIVNLNNPAHGVRMLGRIVQANAGGLLLTLSALTDVAARLNQMDGLPIHWWITVPLLAVVDPVAAHGFRWRRDRQRARFDARLTKYLTGEAEAQKREWIFSSQVYQAQWQMIDGIYRRDSASLTAVTREQSFVDTYGPLMRKLAHAKNLLDARSEGVRSLNHNLQDGFVIVDQLLHFDEATEAPELIVTVRTIARNPRNAAPATDREFLNRWLPSSGRAAGESGVR